LGGDGKESEPPLSLWTRYLEANKKRPLLTKMITTGVLSAVGNVGGQLIIMGKGKQKRIDFKKVFLIHVLSPPKKRLLAGCKFRRERERSPGAFTCA